MLHRRVAPAVVGTILCASLAPVGASAATTLEETSHERASLGGTTPTEADEGAPAAEGAPLDEEAAGGVAPETPADDGADAPQPPAGATVAIVRGGERIEQPGIVEAFATALDGDVIEVSADQALSAPLQLLDGRSVTLRATAPCTISRGEGFPTSGGKVAGMVRLDGGSSLVLEADAGAGARLTLDGADADSDEAVVALNGRSSLTMRDGAAIEDALCSWKPWGAVYVRSGSFILDGGEIRDGFAMKNAAVAVEAGSSFEMRSGSITGNRVSYSQSIVWTKGSVRMTGGTIAGNSSNVSSDGVVHVLSGGSLELEGGTVGNNSPNNTHGVRVDAGGSLSLGGDARLEGSDRVNLADGASLRVSGALTAHSTDDPIEIALSGTWQAGRVVASCASPEAARSALERVSFTGDAESRPIVSVGLDQPGGTSIVVAPEEVGALFDVLDRPFVDGLALDLVPELLAPGAIEDARDAIERHFGGIDTPERRARLDQLDRIERYRTYLEANRDALEASVISASQLGDPSAEARRTNQGYQFDNLDATGLYLVPGRVNEIVVHVEAEDPSKLSVAWRQVGVTDTNSYPSLNLGQKTRLANGENRVTVDLTGKANAYMLYLRNDSTSNEARVRVESADAADPGSVPILGSSLGEHPFYEHDPARPERFWSYVQDVRAHAERVGRGEAADMTLIQMGDEGHAQFAISATAMARAYATISNEEEAVAYVERSNRAIQDRLEFYWAFDGFDASEESGPNAITTARVHTAFTRTVSNPSTMYAYGRYFHMPEHSAASFLSGDDMYGWGMSHEYGHMLDNNVIAVAEETNNLYSIAGSRHGGIEEARRTGGTFRPAAHYHENAMRATRMRDEELARQAADPSYVPDWYNGDSWGVYIWTHVTAWWNGLHFFDDWDYSGYDFEASPYSEGVAADVGRYGAYGATLRILRSDPQAVRTIEELASHATRGVKYNRMAVAFTMGTGYDFAEYLYGLGERDLAPEVLEFCSRYPSMPRKVAYFSLDTDAAIVNGARTYAQAAGEGVAPVVGVEVEGGVARVSASMATDELARGTTAYELYRGDALVGFSRDGSFTYEATEDLDPAELSVIAYDVRLNPSLAAGENGPVGPEEPEGPEVPDSPDPDEPEQPDGTPETPDPEEPEQPGPDEPDGTPETPDPEEPEQPGDGEEEPELPEGPEEPDAPDAGLPDDPGTGGESDGSDDPETGGSDPEEGVDDPGAGGGDPETPDAGGDTGSDGSPETPGDNPAPEEGPVGDGSDQDAVPDADADDSVTGDGGVASEGTGSPAPGQDRPSTSDELPHTGDATRAPELIAAAGALLIIVAVAVSQRLRRSAR